MSWLGRGLLLAGLVLVTACVSSGGGGGSSGGPAPAMRGLFSHAEYDFVLANTTRLNAASASRVLGVVYLEEAEVQARIGPASRITGVTYTLTGLEQSFFSIEPRQAVDLASGVRVSFGSPNFPNTPMTLDYVVNTLGVNRMMVTAVITYLDAQGSERELTVSVPVSVRAMADVPAVNAFIVFEGIRREQRVVNGTGANQTTIMQRQLRFTADGALAENAGMRAGVDGLSAALTRLNIRLSRPAGFTRLPTVYFRLANASGAADCGRVFYLDNQDRNIRTRAGEQLNYEAQAAYGCKLEASLRGEHYTEVVARPSGSALDGIDNVTGGVASGSGNATACAAGDLAVVRAGGCTYRAEFAIAVRDVNEPVVLDVTLRNRSVYEGDVGGLTSQPAVGAVPQQDVLLATVRYREQDHDEANQRLHVAAPVLAAMTPRAAADVFVVQPHGADEVGLYLNVSAARPLDYETLVVNATGQKSYRLLLRATDNSTARLVTEVPVHVEVKDVIYAPTNFTYRNASGGAVTEQALLPGLAQFVSNGGPVLGTLMALDPETQRADVVDYTYIGVSGVAQDRWHRNATINGSFALTGNGADQLTLIGLGLRDGDAFTINLAASHRDAKRPLPADAYASLPVSIRVNYRSDVTGYGAEPPLRFTEGVLNGTVPEGSVGAAVLLDGDDLRAHVDPQSVTGARVFNLLDAQEINNLLAGAPGLDGRLRADIDRALRGLNRADADVFELNATTGALALKADQTAHFTTQPFYTLLVRVSNTTTTTTTATTADYARSDYALLEVAVADTNLAPRLVASRATDARLAQVDQAATLTLDLPEDTTAGTELARLEVMDDNPLRGLAWRVEPADASAASMVQVVPIGASRLNTQTNNYTGTYALQTTTALNYEALQQGRLALTLSLTDGGQYGVDLRQRRVHALERDHEMLMVEVDGNITDVNEPIALRVASTAAVPEDAAVGMRIVAVDVVDPDGDIGTASKLITQLRSVPAALAPALTLANFSFVSANSSRWYLEVANASLLENAGDGRTFELTIMVTENRSDAPTSATARLALTVADVVHDFVVPDLTNLALNISEQQALDASSGLVLREELFSLAATQADYDEFWFGRFRVADAQARAGAMGYTQDIEAADALIGEAAFNLLNLRTRGDAVDLLLGEARLIEDKLIGDRIELMVELVDPSGAVASATLPVPVTIVQSDASDRVRFADADDGFGMEVPSAYEFKYAQSDYTPPLSASACRAEDPAVNITIDERCYTTVRLEDGRDYVQRDRRAQRYFGAEDAALRNGTGAEIGLVFTKREVNVSALGIYTLNAEGNLRAADTEFEQYFELAVDQHYQYAAEPRPALVVRQRELAVLNRTTGQPLANQSYLALDTLPLSEAEPQRSMQFLVIVMEDGGDANNATQRAIAQLNFLVEAANLNVPVVVADLVLGNHRLSPEAPLMLVENGVDRGLEAAVNTARPILNIAIRNPDGFERNQSVTVTVDVVAMQTGEDGSGSFDLEQGTARGRDLVRLGAEADARPQVNITLGSDQTVRATLPFQLARNTQGSALVRLHLVELDADGLEVENRVVHYGLVVGDDAREPQLDLAPLAVNDLSTPIGENVLDALTARDTGLDLNMTLMLAQAEGPRNLVISRVTATGQSDVLRVADRQRVRPPTVLNPTTTSFYQPLGHTEHQYGTTRFEIRAQVREPRGFDDRLSAPYPLPPVIREIVVRPQNDPLQACGSGQLVACDDANLVAQSVSYRLIRDFGNPPGLNQRVRSRNEVVLYFKDTDVAIDDMAALPQPADVRVMHMGPQPFANTTINLVNGVNFNVPSGTVDITRVAAERTDIRVRFPVELTLSEAQYAGLAASGGRVVLNIMVNVTDRGSSSLFALAPARIRITVSASDTQAMVGDYAGDMSTTLHEGDPMGTPMPFGAINLTDPDVTRASGETYTYNLTLHRAGLPWTNDLLRWSHGANETLRSQDSSRFQRSIQLARSPDDADVGTYTVGWSIREGEGTVDADINRLVASGTFTLTIVNQEEAPTVHCDASNGTDVCGYEEGEVVLQSIFGTHDVPDIEQLLDTTARVKVVFTDPDLLVPNLAALPMVGNVSLIDATLSSPDAQMGGELTIPAERLSLGTGVAIERVEASDRFTVTGPILLNLTRAGYDFVNERAGAILNFNLNLNHTLGSTSARARLLFNADANNPTFRIPANFTGGAVSWREDTAARTPLVSDPIMITDPDVRRPSGDNYTYALMVMRETPSAREVSDLLAWSNGEQEDRLRLPSQHFTRTLVFAKELTDADVGRYTVTWSLTDALHTRRAPSSPAAEGRFTLTIMNVNDPLTVVCDADDATDDCGYGLARYLLSDLNPARVDSDLVASDTNVTVLFADDDVLAGLLHLATVANFADADPADALRLNGTNFGVNMADIDIQREGDTNRINVTFPVRLRLTQEQFANLNASGTVATLTFNFTLADPGGSGAVSANGSIELLPDRDGDGLTDPDDNCPLIANADGQDDDRDGDGIGDPCETEAVLGLTARSDPRTTNVNLSWTNPANSALRVMNISYHVVGSSAAPTEIDVTAHVDRTAGVATSYVVAGLEAGTNYNFMLSGIDFRHGLRNQTLVPVSINQTTSPDGDGDGTVDAADNCPLEPNSNQADGDGDRIGDACEAIGVSGLTARVYSTTTNVSLSWTNPTNSVLRALNISYREVGSMDAPTEIDVTAHVDRAAGAATSYVVEDPQLMFGRNYAFTIGGIDARHGRRDQTLVPVAIEQVVGLDGDGDGTVDALDNCPRVANNQDDNNGVNDGDGIGDACEAIGVADLRALVAGETSINLTWTNPAAGSELRMLTITYGPTADSNDRSTVTITTAMDLAAGAAVSRSLSVTPDVWYNFTVGGSDARHGTRNQDLPLESVRLRTRTSRDGDGIADAEDNCIFDSNPGQEDGDSDGYGDACGPDRDNDGLRDIYNAAQLNAVRSRLTMNFELVTDIDLSSYTNWNPISGFSGGLEGNTYTITNLSIARGGNIGLFGQVNNGANIRNLTVRVNNIRGSDSVGGLVGRGPSSGSATVRDVAVIVDGSISASAANAYVGGIVGRSQNGQVNIRTSYVIVRGGISATGTVRFANANAGGLIGVVWHGGQIQNSYVIVPSGGSIRSSGQNAAARTGGLVGNYRPASSVAASNSYAVVAGAISGSSGSGGLMGRILSSSSVTNSYYAPASLGRAGAGRTLQQLKCPTTAGATCASATSYSSWSTTIWNFGNNQQLPDLRSNPRPAYIDDLLP